MESNIENAIEWLTGDGRICLSLTQKRFINRIRKLETTRPDDVDIITNQDGSICAHVPLSWLKINPTKELTEEQRAELSERMRRTSNTGRKST